MTVNVCSFKDTPKNALVINTTSHSKTWSIHLSPFLLGPIELYDGHVADLMENAWQFSKVYPCHADENGNVTAKYFRWAVNGWESPVPQRYPMGKGTKPLYSYWAGEKLSYIEARNKIYIPLYAKAVAKTKAFQLLKQLYEKGDIWLWDFDGYDFRKLGMSYDDVRNCETRKMGHAFVLAMMLDGVPL